MSESVRSAAIVIATARRRRSSGKQHGCLFATIDFLHRLRAVHFQYCCSGVCMITVDMSSACRSAQVNRAA